MSLCFFVEPQNLSKSDNAKTVIKIVWFLLCSDWREKYNSTIVLLYYVSIVQTFIKEKRVALSRQFQPGYEDPAVEWKPNMAEP